MVIRPAIQERHLQRALSLSLRIFPRERKLGPLSNPFGAIFIFYIFFGGGGEGHKESHFETRINFFYIIGREILRFGILNSSQPPTPPPGGDARQISLCG